MALPINIDKTIFINILSTFIYFYQNKKRISFNNLSFFCNIAFLKNEL